MQVGAPEGSSSDETTYASPPAALPTNLTNTREVVNADNERSLIVIRASGGSTDLSMGDGHFSTSLAVDAFEIEDLLVGPRCPRHAYLARSFVVTRETPHHAMHGAVLVLLLDLLYIFGGDSRTSTSPAMGYMEGDLITVTHCSGHPSMMHLTAAKCAKVSLHDCRLLTCHWPVFQNMYRRHLLHLCRCSRQRGR